MRIRSEEEELKHRNDVGKIDPAVGLPVQEREVTRIRRSSISTGKQRGNTREEHSERAHRIGEIDGAVLVAVAGKLRQAGCDAVAAQGHFDDGFVGVVAPVRVTRRPYSGV
mgnify:CR=1 FL=1